MSTQDQYSILFIVLLAVQITCSILSFKSKKSLGKYVGRLNITIMFPIIGNLIILRASNEAVSEIGYYISYIGMTLILLAVTHFTVKYCKGIEPERKHNKYYLIYVIGFFDIFQLLLGTIIHHVFTVEKIILPNKEIFYMDMSSIGLTFHRVLTYIIYGCIVITYIVCTAKASKLYKEKYLTVLIILLAAGIAQGLFIYSKLPIDRSIVVHSLFGAIVFYLSILYQPLKLLDALMSSIISDMDDAVFVFDNMKKCLWVNDNGYRLLGIEQGKLYLIKEAFLTKFGDLSDKSDKWSAPIERDGFHYIIEKKAVKSNNKLLDGYYIVIKDDTERFKTLEKERYESTHDSLTGMYNIQYLYTYIEHALSTTNDNYSIIYINIKNFKIVNDIFGRKFGDTVLRQFGQWLQEKFKNTGICGRLMGDTFGIFIKQCNYNEVSFLNDLSEFTIQGKNIKHSISVHIGVYEITDKFVDVATMFDRAHLALSSIESNYKTDVKHYDDALRDVTIKEQQYTSNISDAISNNEIKPYLQPIVDNDNNIVGAEALVRWDHPEFGLLSPSDFVTIFEKNGLIADIDKYIWKCACETLYKWKDTQFRNLFLSINISPIDFYFIDVITELKNLLSTYELNPEKLRIEITESTMMSNSEEKMALLRELRKLGFIIEMDDFGSGYSSLNLLKDMPVDVLKIDMQFLSNDSKRANIIIKNIVRLARDLKIVPLIEGVETQEQYDMLKGIGVLLFQGYYFNKPLNVEEFEDFLIKMVN